MPSKPKQPKPKLHKFDVFVRTFGNRESAKNAILCAFGARSPDGCEFYLSPVKKKLKK